MARTNMADVLAALNTLAADNAALRAEIAALRNAPAAPRAASADRPRTFATKLERESGNGFKCACGRNDLRTAPHAGSFHKRPDGTTHTI